ncbi:glycosyltransferase family protein [Flavobacterium phragmitis]|uniref:Uncharacterized protein n=1 Tax=Flavobacterium phragmitis TaxID=739143 RepID=A0A1I1UST0_9FLAO|nr:hypothetical protein [Flavobacterium phragmitis]SFD73645.1 hypothetical protein SAMN05216297_111158 [Flavobacterium phragmitis]
MNYNKIIFIGCFNIEFSSNDANSPAANQVQVEIIDSISKVFPESIVKVSANKPKRTWPFSSFLQPSERIGKYKFQGYFNIVFLRDISIYFKHFLMILNFKPNIIFKYNTTLFESLFLYLVKLIFKTKIVLFIQDVSYQDKSSNFLNRYLEILGLKIASDFDVLVPITKDFVSDFGFQNEKCVVFQGGLTSQAKKLMSSEINFEAVNESRFLVFAGALEEYNGIKDIVDYWVKNTPDFDLHIYGKGPFEEYVKGCAAKVSTIKYFGFADECKIVSEQLLAYGNFCFRNSKGINQKYFFPSKLYNVLASPGRALVNDFDNFPSGIKEKCYLLDEDLNNFDTVMSVNCKIDISSNHDDRRDWLRKYANWSFAIEEVKKLLK